MALGASRGRKTSAFSGEAEFYALPAVGRNTRPPLCGWRGSPLASGLGPSHRRVTAENSTCFCFLRRGPGPSDRPGGGVVNENSISLRPAQSACAECAGCARVAGKLTSLRAAEIDGLSCLCAEHAPGGLGRRANAAFVAACMLPHMLGGWRRIHSKRM